MFLRGCGLSEVDIECAKLHEPALTPLQVCDITHRIAELRMQPIAIGGVFISYSHEDATFVDKLYDRLGKENVRVWLDRHDMIAGDMQRQVTRALRLNDVVVIVLSEHSVESAWVEKELEDALKKEKAEKRHVLCPVALDDAWRGKTDDVLWRQLFKKSVLDFAKWEDEANFEAQFARLLKGLKIFYSPAVAGPLEGDA